MSKADALSRREDHAQGIEDDNKGVTMIKPEWIGAQRKVTFVEGEGAIIIDKIKKSLKNASNAELEHTNNYKLVDGLYYIDIQIYVPDDPDLKLFIVKKHHNTPVAGHPGARHTQELVERHYWWPGLAIFVKNYVRSCHRCQQFKGQNIAPAGKLQPLPIPTAPWVDISVDFTMDLPVSNGYDTILVVIDRFSKEGRFIPCNKDVTALDTACLYLNHVWKIHGLPTTIVSDRGLQFAAKVMQELCKLLGIQSKLSTAFHLQTDGQMEWLNRDLQ